ncbi:hypothetical protein M758_UG324900 [Ceratodon purpureus]|nr:hypothetical protein M758_UG324900 [Ceratodon purpureus]
MHLMHCRFANSLGGGGYLLIESALNQQRGAFSRFLPVAATEIGECPPWLEGPRRPILPHVEARLHALLFDCQGHHSGVLRYLGSVVAPLLNCLQQQLPPSLHRLSC